MIKQTLILLFSLLSCLAIAQEQKVQPLFDIKVGVELNKLEQSAQNIDHSIKLASKALQEMAKNPNLSAEQQTQIVTTFEQIERLSKAFETSLTEIPIAISQSTPPILLAMDNLFSKIQLTIILILVALLLILICALIAIYFWILKPTNSMLLKTTSRIDDMTNALKTTAEIVDKSTEQQLLILDKVSTEK